MKKLFILAHAAARANAIKAIEAAPDGYRVTISPPVYTNAQREKFWAMCQDLAKQVPHHGTLYDKDTWHDIILSAYGIKGKVIPTLEGDGFVMTRISIKHLTKAQMSDVIELMYAVGAQAGVVWTGKDCE